MGFESTIAEKVISSNIKGVYAWCKRIYNIYWVHTAEHFAGYHKRAYGQYSVINTLALKNPLRKLTDIYVPQTLVDVCSVKEKNIKIDHYPVELMRQHNKIRIIDAAGMGKSTIMKRMFVDLIDKGFENIGIPIYIELNKLNKDQTILNLIQEELCPDSKVSPDSKKFDGYLLLKLFQRDSFIFFMDGYDEIPNALRTEVTKDIQDFIKNAGNKHYYILTSRPGISLAGFSDFHEFRIQPLKKHEAFMLLSKYDATKQKTDSRDLKRELKSGKFDLVFDCLTNPMLVSLLFFVYINNRKTFKKHFFFDEIYKTYFENHDYTKVIDSHEKQSDLDRYSFNKVLRRVAYVCMTSGKDEFDERLIMKAISDAKSNCSNSKFGESEYLNDLLLAVPFFSYNGTVYKWVHKPLMEYFAALFLADDVSNYDKCINEVCRNAPFDMCVNVLDVFYEIDSKIFLAFVMRPLCEKFIGFYDSKKTNTFGINVKGGIIDTRIGLLFHFDYAKLGIVNIELYKNEGTMIGFTKLGDLPNCHLNRMSSSKDAYLLTRLSDAHPLLIILYQIIPSYYAAKGMISCSSAKEWSNAFGQYEISDFCDEEKLNDIDERTGEENEEAYQYINELLTNSLDSNPKIVPLDYQVCIKKIDSLRKIKEQNDRTIDESIVKI